VLVRGWVGFGGYMGRVIIVGSTSISRLTHAFFIRPLPLHIDCLSPRIVFPPGITHIVTVEEENQFHAKKRKKRKKRKESDISLGISSHLQTLNPPITFI
jgi:hypothetical protein